jgi:hypothetical protein
MTIWLMDLIRTTRHVAASPIQSESSWLTRTSTPINAANAAQRSKELEEHCAALVARQEQLCKEKEDLEAKRLCVTNFDEVVKAQHIEIQRISEFNSKTRTRRPSNLTATRLYANLDTGAGVAGPSDRATPAAGRQEQSVQGTAVPEQPIVNTGRTEQTPAPNGSRRPKQPTDRYKEGFDKSVPY